MYGVIRRSNTLASPRVSNEILNNSLNNTEGSIMEKSLIERFKIILIGDASVGKSALLTRFSENTFLPSYTTTIGIDFNSRMIRVDHSICKLEIWDTAGQEDYDRLRPLSYPQTDVFLVCFSLVSPPSFENVRSKVQGVDL